jgi:hypothetical protein
MYIAQSYFRIAGAGNGQSNCYKGLESHSYFFEVRNQRHQLDLRPEIQDCFLRIATLRRNILFLNLNTKLPSALQHVSHKIH